MEYLNSGSLAEVWIRWKLAHDHLADLGLDGLPEDHALRVVVGSDVPRLIRELTRLRPELDVSAVKIVQLIH